MARVLLAIGQSGLEFVLVAVERVLESGLASAEQVENMPNRPDSDPVTLPGGSPSSSKKPPLLPSRRIALADLRDARGRPGGDRFSAMRLVAHAAADAAPSSPFSAMRLRVTRSTLPVAFSGIWLSTMISSGAL